MSTQASLTIALHADHLVTMDSQRREIPDGGLVTKDGVIRWVGPSSDLPVIYRQAIDEGQAVVLPCQGSIVTPGLINTHHHMYQTLTRALPEAQNAELFGWLQSLYPIWAGLTPEMLRASSLTAMAELMLSGCTTSSDHHYIFPNGCRLDDSIDAALTIGMRFHASRGSMSVGRSQGGLPPDSVVENEDEILKDTQRLIERYHDSDVYAMLRIVVAPCSPFSVSQNLMRESSRLARHFRVSMHTHLAESENDIHYSREKFAMTPAQYAENLGWVGPDVWHAHCVKLDQEGMQLFARTGTGVAHCPSSNMRLASGIAPIQKMRQHGVAVGLGVDGSASNDSSHMLAEVRQAMLLQRVGYGPSAMSAREALELATLGGAKVLGRDDIGALEVGKAADFVAFDVQGLGHAGAELDPVGALVFCTPAPAKTVVINGKVVVQDGVLTRLDVGKHAALHRRLARQLVQKI